MRNKTARFWRVTQLMRVLTHGNTWTHSHCFKLQILWRSVDFIHFMDHGKNVVDGPDSENHVSSFIHEWIQHDGGRHIRTGNGQWSLIAVRRLDFTSCGDVRESPEIWSDLILFRKHSFVLKCSCLNQVHTNYGFHHLCYRRVLNKT